MRYYKRFHYCNFSKESWISSRPTAHDFFSFFNFLTKINVAFVYFRSRKMNAESVDFAPRLSLRSRLHFSTSEINESNINFRLVALYVLNF